MGKVKQLLILVGILSSAPLLGQDKVNYKADGAMEVLKRQGEKVQRLTKTCASKFVLELVRRAFNGLATEHLPVPPAALAPKPDLVYFELTMSGPCALSMSEARDIGVYVPEALPGTYLEAAVLLPP